MAEVFDDATLDSARLGSWCPKMCTHSCPVHDATGRSDAVPWHFHRMVVGLADGRLEPGDNADQLTACSGCLACQGACTHGLDVPAEVRAARALTGPATAQARDAIDQIGAGRRPDGTTLAIDTEGEEAPTVLHVGCRDTAESAQATLDLLSAAGHDARPVADGCCGQLAADLGSPSVARARRSHHGDLLAGATRLVSMDPHCTPALTAAAGGRLEVEDPWTLLAADPPSFEPADQVVTYHDPCLSARRDEQLSAPRELLAAAGYDVLEPERHGVDTACSGAGMGMPLLDGPAASATATRRATLLDSAARTTITACSRAGAQLRHAGVKVYDLATALANQLPATRST